MRSPKEMDALSRNNCALSADRAPAEKQQSASREAGTLRRVNRMVSAEIERFDKVFAPLL
jgi:hypothetical protein